MKIHIIRTTTKSWILIRTTNFVSYCTLNSLHIELKSALNPKIRFTLRILIQTVSKICKCKWKQSLNNIQGTLYCDHCILGFCQGSITILQMIIPSKHLLLANTKANYPTLYISWLCRDGQMWQGSTMWYVLIII